MGTGKKKHTEHVISLVYPDSIAREMGIEAGDVLLEVNGKQVRDVFDYRFLMKDEYVEVLIASLPEKNGCWRLTKSMMRSWGRSLRTD